jgi:hypothetical protein
MPSIGDSIGGQCFFCNPRIAYFLLGGSGLVFYTDDCYWDREKGDFDERCADDWDVNMQEEREERAQKEEYKTVFYFHDDESQPIGYFEKYTNRIGSNIMNSKGWKPGKGLGPHEAGITNPIVLPSQMSKRGLGFSSLQEERRERKKAKISAPQHFIATIYDTPTREQKEASLERNKSTGSFAIPKRKELSFVPGGYLSNEV